MKAMTAAEMQAAAPQIIQLLDKLTGSTDAQEAAEERAAKIAAENADPVKRAEKELLCMELIKNGLIGVYCSQKDRRRSRHEIQAFKLRRNTGACKDCLKRGDYRQNNRYYDRIRESKRPRSGINARRLQQMQPPFFMFGKYSEKYNKTTYKP